MKCPKLKTGQRVELANGKVYMVITNFTTNSGERQKFVLVNRTDFIYGDDYEQTELLTIERKEKEYDIMKIYEYDTLDGLFTMGKVGKLLWERPVEKK